MAEDDFLVAAVRIRDQQLIVTFVLNSAGVNHSLAIGRECDRAGYITHDLPRGAAQSRDTIEICVVSVGRVLMGVIKIVAVWRKGNPCAYAKEPALWRNHRNLAAGGDLLHAHAALALTPAIGHQSAVRRNAGKPDRLSVLGQLPDGDIASIDRGRVLVQKFVGAKGHGD